MLPGPLILKECSGCGETIAEESFMSGNTFDARYWTDGKMEAPMLTDEPLLVKCPYCNSLVWVYDLKQVGEIDPRDYFQHFEKKEFPGYLPVKTPTFRDYVIFLNYCIKDAEKERYTRICAWRAGNDKRRHKRKVNPLSLFETKNMRALITLLDESEPDQRIVKAELYRELGEFDEAEKLLDYSFDEDFQEMVSFIGNLVEKRVADVTEIVQT